MIDDIPTRASPQDEQSPERGGRSLEITDSQGGDSSRSSHSENSNEKRSIDVFEGTALLDAAIAANGLSELERQLLSSTPSDTLHDRSYSYGMGEMGLAIDGALRVGSYASSEQRAWLADHPSVIGSGVVLGAAYVATSDIPISRTFQHSLSLGDGASLSLSVTLEAGTTQHLGPLRATAASATFRWSF